MAQGLRRALIGNEFAVQFARLQPFQTSTKFAQDIAKDVERTFPTHPVSLHREKVDLLLNQFAALHSIGYAQGMNFLAMGLYWVYVEDCPTHALRDALYSLPRLLKICLPIYPVNPTDRGPMRFCRAVAKCLGHFFPGWTPNTQTFCEVFILHFWPPLFANLFSLEDALAIWTFLVGAETDRRRYARLFLFTLELIRPHQKAFVLGADKAFKIISAPHVHCVEKAIERALRQDGKDPFS